MTGVTMKSAFLLLTFGICRLASAQTSGSGHVQLDIATYQELVQKAGDKRPPAPVGYALGTASVEVEVGEGSPPSAEVRTRVSIEILEERWVLVPVLSAGTAVAQVLLDGNEVQLVPTPHGLALGTDQLGTRKLELVYHVGAAASENGFSLAVPVPAAASIQLSGHLPGSFADVAVIPSAGLKTSDDGGNTAIAATIPTTTAVHLSWRLPITQGAVVSRASYRGDLQKAAMVFRAELGVELFGQGPEAVPLFPSSVTLTDVQVDGRPAAIVVQGERFVTLVRGRGLHKVTVAFEAPVVSDDGPPSIELQLPSVPVSRFELRLPGRKEVSAEPAASVTTSGGGGGTTAVLFVPLTETLRLTWSEAVPDSVRTDTRANAGLYHAAWAEEGVLYVRALVEYEVTSGKTSQLTLEVPAEVAVNRVESASGGIADWRVTKQGRSQLLSIFLDHELEGTLQFEVAGERLLSGHHSGDEVGVPLLRAIGVHRQRGMLALLSTKELALKPAETKDKDVSRVGENQLPAWVRQAIEMTIAHTYKYGENPPALYVQTTSPEKRLGKVDAQVDTLVSLGDVSLKGAATVELNIKSGTIDTLAFELPAGVNLLNLAAPSLRTPHKVGATDRGQLIELQFTQEMEGQVRVELSYERILTDKEAEISVPALHVVGAEIEQGRIAVEALTAVEVQPASVEQLSTVDIMDLPQQLVLKTTNPILLAYKYAHAEPPPKLVLKIARHKEIEVQSATIDEARYSTLYTRDGLAVTTARFTVRNSRKQFLKVALPEGSEVWSALVDGKPEKPAMEGEGRGASQVLIKIINSTQGFVVELVYATPVSRISGLGTVSGRLPRPDMVVTASHWSVYLPEGLSYGEPKSNMEVSEDGEPVSREAMQAGMGEGAGGSAVEPPRLAVPNAGVLFRFEKLYANRADEEAEFSIPYASGGGAFVAHVLMALATLVFWAALFFAWRGHARLQRRYAAGIAGGAALVVLVITTYLGTSPWTAFGVTGLIAAVIAARALRGLYARRKASRPPPPKPPPSAPTPTEKTEQAQST